MATADFFVGLARTLRDVIRPLEDALDSPVEFAVLLREHGWHVEGDPTAARAAVAQRLDLGTRLGALETELAELLGDGSATADEAIALLGEAKALLESLGAGAPLSGAPAPLNRPDFWSTFGTDLAQTLCATYLELTRPALFALLCLAGVIERRNVPADGTPGRVAYTRTQIHWDRLGTALTDPEALATEVYGWGSALQHEKLTEALQRAVYAFGIPVRRRLAEHQLVDTLYAADNPALTTLREVRVPLLIRDDYDSDRVELGLAVLPIPPKTDPRGAPVGLLIGPYASGAFGARVPLGGLFELEFKGGLAADAAVGVELRPGNVVPRLTAGTTTLDAGATLTGARLEPWRPLGSEEGNRVEVHDVALGLEVRGTASDPEVRVRLGSSRIDAVVDLGEGDGFLNAVLGSEAHTLTTAVALVWSSKHGLTFEGSGSLALELPVALEIAGIAVTRLSLAIAASDSATSASASVAIGAQLGPVAAAIEGVGVELRLDAADGAGDFGGLDLSFGFKSPTRLGLSVDAGPVVGGGFLGFDPDKGEYAGELHLEFEGIAVRALGLLTTRLPGGKPGYSLLVLVSADFPPMQLGMGFMLVGVGGLLGINRTVAVEALRAGLKTGALGAVLSPPDPKASAGQLVSQLAGLFPPAAGRHVFAPTARIVWGSPTLITIELALVLELPSPVRLVVLGRLRAALPSADEAIVRLQVDILGVIDFDRQEAAVDATLVDSRLAQFALTGDMALRMSWGNQPSFLLAVGGFHPRFAAPPGFPALERVAVALASGDNPKLRLEAYLALTSNTVQFGARVDLAAKAGSFSIAGFLSFDALVTLAPLGFVVDIAAKLAVKAGGHTILSISLALTLSGPKPWRARGRASFSILFFDISFGFDVTIGDDAQPVLPPPVDVAPLLLAALTDTRSWSASGAASVVTLRALEPGNAVLAHPLATLQVRQRVAPLDRTLERFGSSTPSGAKRFRITTATIGGIRTTLTPLKDRFAPAQFSAMSDDAKLSAPSFEEMTSGAALGADGYTAGTAVSVGVAYEQLVVTAAGIPEPSRQRIPMPGDVLTTLTATAAERPPAFAMKAAA